MISIKKTGIIFILVLSVLCLMITMANFLNKYKSPYEFSKCIGNNDTCLVSLSMSLVSMSLLLICSVIIFSYLIWTPGGHYANNFFNKNFQIFVIILVILAFVTQLISAIFGVDSEVTKITGSNPTVDTDNANLPLFSTATILSFLSVLVLITMVGVHQRKH